MKCSKESGSNVASEMLFYDGIEADNENVWLICGKYNALVEIERETGRMVPCGFIPFNTKKNHILNPFRYRCLLKYENKLFLFPHDENDICVFDMKERNFEYIELDHKELKEVDTWKFTGCEKIGNKAVVYGFNSLVLILDLSTFEIKYLDIKDSLYEVLEIEYWFLRYSYIKGTKIFLSIVSYPCVIEIDVFSGHVKYYKLHEQNNVLIDNPVLEGANLFYFERKKGDTVILKKYDLESEALEVFDFGIEKSNMKTFGFVTYYNNNLWMLPGACESGYKFDVVKKNLDIINDLPVANISRLGSEFPYEFNYRNGIRTNDNHIIAIHAWSCQMVDIDMTNENVKVISIIKKEIKEWDNLFQELIENFSGNDIKIEWIEGMLETYLRRADILGKKKNCDVSYRVGNIIYKELKSQC